MKDYFIECHTSQEVKDRYRELAKKLHPDTGGTDRAFQIMQEQYEHAIAIADSLPKLPPLYHVSGHYTYFGHKVIYYQRDSHYYKFDKPGGGYIWITKDQQHLIKVAVNAIVA